MVESASRAADDAPAPWSRIVEHDVATQRTAVHQLPAQHWPSEAIFVPRGALADEDDGYLLSVVYDGSCDSSYLLVLDARDVTTPPVARVGPHPGPP